MKNTKYAIVLQDVSSKLFLTFHDPMYETIGSLWCARRFRTLAEARKKADSLNKKIRMKDGKAVFLGDRLLKKCYVIREIPWSRFEAKRTLESVGSFRPAV